MEDGDSSGTSYNLKKLWELFDEKKNFLNDSTETTAYMLQLTAARAFQETMVGVDPVKKIRITTKEMPSSPLCGAEAGRLQQCPEGSNQV